MRPLRPLTVGPDEPTKPYPYTVHTQITSGFGRGSSELGIPTANIPPGELADLDPGVYYGWARVSPASSTKTTHVDHQTKREIEFNYGSKLDGSETDVLPMVMSIGWNPYYQNREKSAEVHILHKFAHQFYGARISVCVCGFIRPEQSYDSLDDLVSDIHTDIEVAKRSLDRPAYTALKVGL